MKRYIIEACGWYACGPCEDRWEASSDDKKRRKIFYKKANAISWIAYRISKGYADPGYWNVKRLVRRKPKKAEIYGTITGSQWVSEDGSYINVVSPFLQEHAGQRIKVTYELC